MKAEWKNLREHRFLIIVLLAILTIPTIYTTLFLSSMWNPYGKVSSLPVAIVNEDQSVTLDGSPIHIGDDLVDQLKKSNSLKYYFVSSKKAADGLKSGTYYMVVTIPKDFSKNATTLMDTSPKQMTLYYDTNPGKNYIATKMCESAMLHIKDEVSSSVTNYYSKNIFTQLHQVKDGFSTAVDGTNTLSDGLTQLLNGDGTLASGLGTLSQNLNTFQSGVTSLQNGLDQYTQGVSTINTNMATVKDGSAALSGGLNKLNTALNNVTLTKIALSDEQKNAISTAASNQVSDYSSQLSKGLSDGITTQIQTTLTNQDTANAISQAMDANPAIAQMETVLMSSGYSKEQADATVASIVSSTLQAASSNISSNQIEQGISGNVASAMSQVASKSAVAGANGVADSVNQTLDSFGTTLNTLKDSVSQLSTGATELNNGINQLSDGTASLDQKKKDLLNGTASLSTGTTKIKTAVDQLHSGSLTLQDGLKQSVSGTKDLSDGLSSGYTTLDSSLKNVSDLTYKMFSNPLDTKETQITTVKNNGTSMAAYMMTVALWVAGMSFCLMYPITQKQGHKKQSTLSFWFAKASIMYPFACAFSALMVFALYQINGLRPYHLKETYLIAMLSAVTFMSILYFFNLLLKKVGAFLMLIFMVLQLSGSAGTYPVQLSAPYVEKITNYLPFTYSIRAFRSALSGGSSIRVDVTVLLGVFLAMNLCILLYLSFLDINKERVVVTDSSRNADSNLPQLTD